MAVNFLRSWQHGRGSARAILLHGPPGCGKTTLVKLLSAEFGWPLIETNASLDHSTTFLDSMAYAAMTAPLGAEQKILFFDEIDSLRESQQGQILDIMRHSSCPIFLACNDIGAVKDDLRKAALNVLVPRPKPGDLKRAGLPADARSYRGGGDELEEIDSIARAKAILRGTTQATPSEFWMLGSWVMDVDDSPLGGYYDRALARYRTVGRPAEKYLRHVLTVAKIEEPAYPWSVTARNRLRAPKSAPTGREKPAFDPPPHPAPKPDVGLQDASAFF